MSNDEVTLPRSTTGEDTIGLDRRAVLGAIGATALFSSTPGSAKPPRHKRARALPGPGDPEWIYNPKKDASPYNYIPYCMYLYYVGSPLGPGGPSVRHYYRASDEAIDDSSLKKFITDLANDALLPSTSYIGSDWKYIYWNRVSYITILIDRPNLLLTKGNGLTFVHTHGGHKNHTFFDAKDFNDIDVGGNQRTAVCFINHLKQDDTGVWPLANEHQYFRFEINFGSKFLYPDSGGTNMGPPVPPPAQKSRYPTVLP
jgi:hypothetical protein